MTKECDICGSEFEALGNARRCSDKCKREFSRRRSRKNYEDNKAAVLAYQSEYYEANKEAIAERKRKWAEANKEAIAAKKREYHEAHKEALNAKRRARYVADRERVLARQREYKREYDRTPAGKVTAKRARAKRRGAPCNGTVKHFKLADKCVRCGSTEELELEHITPISQGGSNHIENLTTMCAECNHGVGGKHTKGAHEWAEFVVWYLSI